MRIRAGFTTLLNMEICKTDVQKIIQYLDDAARLYDALPMQMCKSRAHMIRRMTDKIKKQTTTNHGKR